MPRVTVVYTIIRSTMFARFFVLTSDGDYLRTRKGEVRIFISRAGARKAITREKRGDFHN